ncbi:methionyl-tRNA synthetase [Penicillium malachiteum]|uniref:methionyl-tRNA synthetase n=1 Tax=Penicillium malachiteum TaxID=1324776 RepID=UPI002548926D|nr:methionyl-tRNA synthetase [Penicillium malachiteum]KAJ5725247.1 methionyl-tRNA synthetase [Penicillium malachiteum]
MTQTPQKCGTVLPVPGECNILITSAHPYVNNVPHLGNLIESTLSADVLQDTVEEEDITRSMCTDEYGTTSETRALIEDFTPKQLCDKYHDIHDDVYKCQLLDPLELKNPRCKVDGATPVKKETKHIFLELDKLQSEIEPWFQQAASFGAWSNNGKEITSAWLKEGLKTRSITRDIKWGTPVPLPGYEVKVIYAWFDACIGYVSITANYTNEWQKWWHNPDDVYQFLGKDNVSCHTVIFPGTQIGTRDTWTKVHHLSTDYLTYEGGKFSKSRGIGVSGDSAQKTGVPSDVWHYYLVSHRPKTGDTEFNWDSFISANNNILLKNLGNFVNRVAKFVNSAKFNDIVPVYTQYHENFFDTWKNQVNTLLTDYIDKLEAVKIRGALATVLSISQQGNLFLQSNNLDNKLAADESSKYAAIIGLAVNLIHLLASLVSPFMPETADSINAQLCAKALPIPDHWDANSIKPGHEISKAILLFSSLNPEKASEWRGSFGGQEAQKVKEEEAARKAAKKAAKGIKAHEGWN